MSKGTNLYLQDLLVKNIKRYQRQCSKPNSTAVPDVLPATYVLPQEHALFVEEFKRNSSATFIMKPASKAQGKGIFLINRLSQVRRWSNNSNASTGNPSTVVPPALRPQMDNYIISRYIDNPLLLGGKKFDLRLYVLVRSYRPLVVYMSQLGFARFCNVKYTTEVAELDNMFVHLTNVAVQKHGNEYNSSHGNKWSLENLKLHLEATRGHAATQQLFDDIKALVVHALKSVQQIMINDRQCFELYGFDVIIDNDLKPWLIEVSHTPDHALLHECQ